MENHSAVGKGDPELDQYVTLMDFNINTSERGTNDTNVYSICFMHIIGGFLNFVSCGEM